MDLKGIVAVGAIVMTVSGCQESTRLGVVNRCPGTLEVRGSDERTFDGMRWHEVASGAGVKVADMASSSERVYVEVRSPGLDSKGQVSTFETADLVQVSREQVGYDLEASIADTACP